MKPALDSEMYIDDERSLFQNPEFVRKLFMEPKQKAIAVDFDKTLHKYSKGYADGELYDGPIEGAREAMELLTEQGVKIIIFSVRNIDHVDVHSNKLEAGQKEAIEAWLNKYRIPFDEIWIKSGKPQVDLFVDDKAYRFEGIWRKAVLDILDILKP